MNEQGAAGAAVGTVLVESRPLPLAAGVTLVLLLRCRFGPDGQGSAMPLAATVATTVGTHWLALAGAAVPPDGAIDNRLTEPEVDRLTAAVCDIDGPAVALYQVQWSSGAPWDAGRRPFGRLGWDDGRLLFDPSTPPQGNAPSSSTG